MQVPGCQTNTLLLMCGKRSDGVATSFQKRGTFHFFPFSQDLPRNPSKYSSTHPDAAIPPKHSPQAPSTPRWAMEVPPRSEPMSNPPPPHLRLSPPLLRAPEHRPSPPAPPRPGPPHGRGKRGGGVVPQCSKKLEVKPSTSLGTPALSAIRLTWFPPCEMPPGL